MTAIADPPPVAADVPARQAFSAPTPVATLSVDLMPDEIIVKRRLGYLKRRLVFVMLALIALVVLGDLLVRQQTNGAASDLAGANSRIATLNTQLHAFDKVLSVQSSTQAIRTQLDGVMGDDVYWPALLNRLAAPAPAGLRLTSISAMVDDPDSATGASTADTTSPLDTPTVGTITLSGSAANWRSVATYVSGLSADKDFIAVNPSTVSHGSGSATAGSSGLTFTITLDLTDGVLSNRYSATPAPGAGAGAGAGAGTSASTSEGAATSGSFDKTAGSRTPTGTKSSAHGAAVKRHASSTHSASSGTTQEAS